MGHFGKQDYPVDENLMDRINNLPRTKDFENYQPEEITIEDLRQQFGTDLTDEELLLLVLCAKEDFDAMRKAGPINTEYSYAGTDKSAPDLIRELMGRKNISYVNIQKENFSISLKKGVK